MIRFEPDVKTIYIPCKVIKTYLKSINIEYIDFVNGLKAIDDSILRPKSGETKVMHKGLEMSGPSVRCLWIDSTKFEEKVPVDIPINVN
jgi:hypothetical protein